MPMQKNSTLLLLVNEFQNDLLSVQKPDTIDFEVLAKMGNVPSEQSVKNILDYANSYNVIETDSAGYLEMNLN